MSAYDNRKCYGFVKCKDTEFVAEPQESTVVAMIFDCFLNGQSLSQIANMLESKSISSPSGKATWSRKVLSSIISNEKYLIHGLIAKQTFDMAQIEKENRNGNYGVIACDDTDTANVATSESSNIETVKTENNEVITAVYIAPPRHHSVQNSTATHSESQNTILLMGIPPGFYQQVLIRKME